MILGLLRIRMDSALITSSRFDRRGLRGIHLGVMRVFPQPGRRKLHLPIRLPPDEKKG
jgi:hypothetical protein